MDKRRKTGNDGEDAASSYLSGLGHHVLARNWRAGHLELDIITLAQDGIHFVEVKTRRPPMQLSPQDSVTPTKQKRIVAAAKAYLNRAKTPAIIAAECHFDIVAVTIENTETRIEYYPNAFYPIYV